MTVRFQESVTDELAQKMQNSSRRFVIHVKEASKHRLALQPSYLRRRISQDIRELRIIQGQLETKLRQNLAIFLRDFQKVAIQAQPIDFKLVAADK